MNRPLTVPAAALALSLFPCVTARAHISYTGRDFGTFTSADAPAVSILNRPVSGNYAWADGTDADYGSSEYVRAFRFTLTYDARVTIAIEATSNNGALLGDMLPGFSIYEGLGHVLPALSDHDEAPVSGLWRDSTGGVVKEGNFRALGDWKVGNDTGTTLADLSSFTFKGYGVDGTSANFGSEPGIVGDGVADGRIVKTFDLPAGTYSLFIGGANYAAQVPGDLTSRGVNVTLAVPEPALATLLVPGIAGLLLRRRRRR